MERTSAHKYNTRSSTKRVNNVTNFKNIPNFFQEDATEKIKTHIGTDYFARIGTKKEAITAKQMENHISCKTIGKILGYRDLVNMDEPVWTNSMCNELGRLSQGWGKYSGNDTIEFNLHKDKLKEIKATCVRAVCDIRRQKTETHITRLAAGVNIIDYKGEVITPTSDSTTMKIHVNSSI